MELGGTIGALIAAVISAIILAYVIYTFGVVPKSFDARMRSLLVDYKKWADRDNRHIRFLNKIAVKESELPRGDEGSLDQLRLQRARVNVEIDQLEDLGTFLKSSDAELEQKKYSELDALDRRIDEHPEREAELEETRTRLVVRTGEHPKI